MVGHDVDDHPQAQFMGPAHQGVGVGEGAEDGVDHAVVGDVVAGVGLRRGVERGEPDGVHAEVPEVRQARRHARQVTHAVAVGVGEAARIDLVDDGVVPPAAARVAVGDGISGGVGDVLGHEVPCRYGDSLPFPSVSPRRIRALG